MDLQSRKLNLISYLAMLQDEKILDKIENLVVKNSGSTGNQDIALKEYKNRLEQSEKDFQKGKIVSQEDLEISSAKW